MNSHTKFVLKDMRKYFLLRDLRCTSIGFDLKAEVKVTSQTFVFIIPYKVFQIFSLNNIVKNLYLTHINVIYGFNPIKKSSISYVLGKID